MLLLASLYLLTGNARQESFSVSQVWNYRFIMGVCFAGVSRSHAARKT